MNDTAPISRRRVFYIPGFDPFPPRRYREIYRREGSEQARISGYEIAVKGQGAGWQVKARIEGLDCTADCEVLVWSDIVKRRMSAGLLANYLLMLRTVWIYITTGVFFSWLKTRKGPVIAGLYPVIFLIVQLMVSVLLAWLAGHMGALLHPVFGWVAAVAVFAGTMWLFQRLDRRIYATYLLQDYAYSSSQRGATPAAMQARLSEFEDRIHAALTDGYDEVLVVAHSSGAIFAIEVLAALLRRGDFPETARLSLLTLGHVVPMVSFLPRAQSLRRDLHDLAAQERIFWLDVSAPGDGACFALCDPVSVSGVAPAKKHGPLVISAAFSKTLKPETWQRLRWRFFRLHFQYLYAFDAPGDYDFFRITAGPRGLRVRFAGRAPSGARIETPLSPHTDMAP